MSTAPLNVSPPTERVEGWWQKYRVSWVFFGIDIATILICVVLISRSPRVFEILCGVLTLGALAIADQYRVRFTLALLDDLPRIVAAILVAAAVAAVSLSLWEQARVNTDDFYFLFGLLILLPITRNFAYWLVHQLRKRDKLTTSALIVGAGVVSARLGRALIDRPETGLRLLGYVDSDPAVSPRDLGAPVLGGADELAEVIGATKARQVIVGFAAIPETRLIDVVRDCDREEASIFVIPRLFEIVAKSTEVDMIDGIPVVRLHRGPFRAPTWWLKRALDILASGTALLLLSPLLLLIALVDRIVDGPGIIFRQVRVGIDGREFEVLKFRSMRPATSEESATNWNIKNDDRLSWFGKLIRKSSLDELPQLWNIFRGDMSLVGPRPERPHFVKKFEQDFVRYGARHRVPCGLTGWAQINGLRGDTSIEERARYDNYYIENWSLWFDIKILLRTALYLTKGSG